MLAKILISKSIDLRIEEAAKILAANLLDGNLEFKKHPDILVLESGEKLGIEQTKIVKEHLSFKSFQAKGRGVVIEDASSLTPDAQNSLLKTLEELPENSIFILGINSENDLLPTILSRCELVILNDSEGSLANASNPSNKLRDSSSSTQNDIEQLISSTLEARFEYIEKTKDKKELLQSLIIYFRNQLHKASNKKATKDYLKELLEAEKWINQNVNPRAILEYLMLVMPHS